jgi:hypothetical protein
MNNSLNGKIIGAVFVIEAILNLCKNASIYAYNNKLKEEAIEKRNLCTKICIDKFGNKVAYFKKKLENGIEYKWEEIIEVDPFNLYRLIK